MNPAILPAPLWRRLAAAAYDLLLVAAILMAVGVIDLLLRAAIGAGYYPRALGAALFLAVFGYFGLCWTRGGQTLGARAWRLQVRRRDGGALTWPIAALRYALAWPAWLLLGLGLLWCLLDPRRRAWHDLGSGTEVVLLPKVSR